MSVKRFVAADMRRALELVRQEMGPDAVILSSRRIKKGVEILTSMEPPSARPASNSPADVNISSVDVPMGSDGSWREQLAVEEAIHKSSHRVAGFQGEPSSSSSLSGVSSLGLASGKTSDQLAEEIDRARDRMLAAKKAQSAMNEPIAHRQSQANPKIDTSTYQHNERVEANSQINRNSRYRDDESNYHGGSVNKTNNVTGFSSQNAMNAHQDTSRTVEDRAAAYNQDSSDQQDKLDAMQSELSDMRLLLEQQLSKFSGGSKYENPLQSALMRRLQQMGICGEVAETIISKVQPGMSIKDAWRETLALLARTIPARSTDIVMEGGVFAFVGPTGVGKTTTIAKLAARYVLEHGPQNVTLVTTDTYRIAAQEQLRSLGRILGVQVKSVDDNQDLPSVLRSLKGCPLVLIDTAGFRNGENKLKQQLANIQEIPNVQTLLVMASNGQYQTLKATMHAHKSKCLAGCVLTKLDETASIGEALSVITEHKLPLFYTTDGQEIPQDIASARGHNLVSKAVQLLKEGNDQSLSVSDNW
jgi:flagellar biosynthesis protein FlhF